MPRTLAARILAALLLLVAVPVRALVGTATVELKNGAAVIVATGEHLTLGQLRYHVASDTCTAGGSRITSRGGVVDAAPCDPAVTPVPAATITQLPPVGARIDLLYAPTQDAYACGDAVVQVARALREQDNGGTFSLPVNCPKLALRWPYERRELTGGELLIWDTLNDVPLARLPSRAVPASDVDPHLAASLVRPPSTPPSPLVERREGGALIIELEGRLP